MALTLTKLRARIVHRLGGSVASQLDQDELVNEAGRQLVLMHSWNFLTRPPVSMDMVQGQSYIAFPTDFGEMVALKWNADILSGFTLSTAGEVAEYRAYGGLVEPGAYFGVVVQPTQANSTTAIPVARLEIVPTPAAAVTDALKLWYRAAWTEITFSTGGEIPNIPSYCDSLLTEILMAICQGYEESDSGTLSDRLMAIQQGPLFANAVRYDARKQDDYGHVGWGAAASGRSGDPITWSSVAAPA